MKSFIEFLSQDYLHEASQNAVLIAVPKDPHHGDGKGFWKIGTEVYRASVKGGMDTHGLPMDIGKTRK